jgi:hypothetical protein
VEAVCGCSSSEKQGASISYPGREAYQVARPYQEAPFPGVGIACRRVESQQDLLVAGIQEACLVEELAYLSKLSDFM